MDLGRKLAFTAFGVAVVFVAELAATAVGYSEMGYRVGGIVLVVALWNLWVRGRWPHE